MTPNTLWKLLLSQQIDEPTFRKLSYCLNEQERKSRNIPTYIDTTVTKLNTSSDLVLNKKRRF